jgi:hypothetical protein
LATSDLDAILGLPTFRSIPFLQRAVAVLEALDYPGGLELLCYAPEEFVAKRDEFGIARLRSSARRARPRAQACSNAFARSFASPDSRS